MQAFEPGMLHRCKHLHLGCIEGYANAGLRLFAYGLKQSSWRLLQLQSPPCKVCRALGGFCSCRVAELHVHLMQPSCKAPPARALGAPYLCSCFCFCEHFAAPISRARRCKFIRVAGFEPAIFCTQNRYTTKLCYTLQGG